MAYVKRNSGNLKRELFSFVGIMSGPDFGQKDTFRYLNWPLC